MTVVSKTKREAAQANIKIAKAAQQLQASIVRRKKQAKYDLSPRLCGNPACREIIPFIKRINQFCGYKCAATIRNLNRFLPDDVKKRANEARRRKLSGRPSQWAAKHNLEIERQYSSSPNKCHICGVNLPFNKRHRQSCGEICHQRLCSRNSSRNENCGGFRWPTKRVWYFCKAMGKSVCLHSTYEVKYAEYLDSHEISWIRPEYLSWVDDKNLIHRYSPDFFLIDSGEYVEIKNAYSASLPEVQKKHTSVCAQHKISLIVLTEVELGKLGIIL